MFRLETERLIITQLTLEDAPFVYELLNSPLWLQYIGDRNIRTIDDARNLLESRFLPLYVNPGFAGWRVALKSDSSPIGTCGFYQRDFLQYPDLGFAFLPGHIGKGYGYEAATACLNYGRTAFAFKQLLAITSKDNAASIGLLRKLNFTVAGTTTYPGEEEELLLHEWFAG